VGPPHRQSIPGLDVQGLLLCCLALGERYPKYLLPSDDIESDPYKARKYYTELADKLLRQLPGEHLKEMDKWPKWSAKRSPPVIGGKYENLAWPGPADWKPPPPIPGSVKLSVVYVPPSGGAKAPKVVQKKPEVTKEKPAEVPKVGKPEVPKIQAAPQGPVQGQSAGPVKQSQPAISAAEAPEASGAQAPKALPMDSNALPPMAKNPPPPPIPLTEAAIKSTKKVTPALPPGMKEELAQRRKQMFGSPSVSSGAGTPNNAVPAGGPQSAAQVMAQRLGTQNADKTPDSKSAGSGWDSPVNGVPPVVPQAAVPVAALPNVPPNVAPEPPIDLSQPVPAPEPPAPLQPPQAAPQPPLAPQSLGPSLPSTPLLEGRPIPEAAPISEVASISEVIPLLESSPMEQATAQRVASDVMEAIEKSVVSAGEPSIAELTESSEESAANLADLYKDMEEFHKNDPPQPPLLGISDIVKNGIMMAGIYPVLQQG